MLRRLAVGAFAVVFVVWLFEHAPANSRALDEIPQGVSVARFGDRPTFVVRDGSQVSVFLTDVHHLPGEEALWWCPSGRLFAAPTHGELFDLTGRAVGGPAAYGLDRLDARVVDDRLRVGPDRIIPGAVRESSADLSSTAVSSGQGFCPGALRSDR